MTRIRIHNPCNEHTRYFRYYNYFWDKFTDFLKTKFEVEENRYFENAHTERFKISLQNGTSDYLSILECEYVIENLDNGEFVILSIADELYESVLGERENPYLKKVLISQFIPEKIERHALENFHKYSPWTYFQCAMDDLEFYREKRKSIDNKIEKMYFDEIVKYADHTDCYLDAFKEYFVSIAFSKNYDSEKEVRESYMFVAQAYLNAKSVIKN